MKRTWLILTLALVFFSFGYTYKRTGSGDPISKIYLVDSLLIRTTPGENIRLYDISSPASPRQLSSITIDSNQDVAVQAHYMYADHGRDLLVFNIADGTKPVAVDTVKNLFNSFYGWNEVPVMVEDRSVGGSSGCNSCATEDMATSAPVSNRGGSESGKGGSLARFVIVGNYLYCIDASRLLVLDIVNPAAPRYMNIIDVAWDIETVFPDGDRLFIGGQQGMYIYNIADRRNPSYLSQFTHARSCDPVVVEGDRAYVTLRGGSPCGGFSNQLDIIDISNIRTPRLLKSVPLAGPYGLTVRDQIVLVCDGAAGGKILDTRNLENIHEIGSIKDLVPYDVILDRDLLIVTAETGFYLYDATDLAHPRQYGKLP